MAKNNQKYWEERQIEAVLRSERDADKLHKEMKEVFQETADNINDEISKLYGRFARNNKISPTEAMAILQGDEYKRWRMSLEKYMGKIKALEQADPGRAKTLLLELNALSSKSRLNRLEAMEAQINAHMAYLATLEEQMTRKHLENQYKQSYYKAMYEQYKDSNPIVLEKMVNHSVRVDPLLLHDVLTMPWSGANYSENIWKREHDIANRVKRLVTQQIMTGASIQRLTKDVTRELGKDYAVAAKRLIRTETAYVHSMADIQTYKELEVEEYQFLATLDRRTSLICRSLDGQHFKITEAMAGKNYPPMHPNCRSATIEYDPKRRGTRLARDEDGSTYKAPRGMTYNEWYESVTQNIEVAEMDAMKMKPQISSEKNKVSMPGTNVQNVEVYKVVNSKFDMWVEGSNAKKQIRLTDELLKDIETMVPEGMKMPKVVLLDFDKHKQQGKIAGYTRESDTIFLNMKFTSREQIIKEVSKNKGYFARTDEYSVILHELGHKYHYDTVKRIAKTQEMSYDRAKEMLDDPIRKYIKEKSVSDESYFRKQLSKYASDMVQNEDKRRNKEDINEVMAEYFSTKDKNRELSLYIQRNIQSLAKE